MKIGLVSDTHDRLPFIDRAVRKLNDEGVDLVLHAGDYSAPFAALRFSSLKSQMIGVFGNNDAEKELLQKNFEKIGKNVRGKFAEVKVENLKIALLHGEEIDLLESIINTSAFDIVVHGHTHQASIHKQNGTLIVNPGEACGYLTENATIGILYTDTMKVELVTI
ncbi:MAG: metallophosphoesterase [Candidatus Bathyarchaeia archaeon]|nr:metallophosphoesterase [Candidatus Bathyarchaeota archaeon]